MNDYLQSYLEKIAELPLLTAKDEINLAERIHQGDLEARNRLIESNILLVVKLAKFYTGRGLTIEDLITEGTLGLIRAVEGFDPDRECRFSTYATFWIIQSIKRGLTNIAKAVRIPSYLYPLMSQWRKTEFILRGSGQDASPAAIAKILNINKRTIPKIIAGLRLTNNYDRGDDKYDVMGNLIATNDSEDPLIMQEEVELLYKQMDGLTYKEREVIESRFGLKGRDERTLLEIGNEMGVSRERVRQIENLAIEKLLDRLTHPEKYRNRLPKFQSTKKRKPRKPTA